VYLDVTTSNPGGVAVSQELLVVRPLQRDLICLIGGTLSVEPISIPRRPPLASLLLLLLSVSVAILLFDTRNHARCFPVMMAVV
jgi:hypothetical protein